MNWIHIDFNTRIPGVLEMKRVACKECGKHFHLWEGDEDEICTKCLGGVDIVEIAKESGIKLLTAGSLEEAKDDSQGTDNTVTEDNEGSS